MRLCAAGGIALGPVNTIDWRVHITEMPVWLVDPVCTGTEGSLEKCRFTQWGEPLVSGCFPAYTLCYKTSGIMKSLCLILFILLLALITAIYMPA